MPTLVPYARQSRTGEESLSLDDQINAMKVWADTHGVELSKPVIEESVSGDTPWRQRELGGVIAQLKAGEADGVIVAYFSRLTREKHSASFELLEELQPFRRVEANSGRDVKPGTEIGWEDVIQTHQSRTERLSLRKHLSTGKHRAWELGAYVSPLVPAGYVSTTRYTEKGKAKTGPLEKTEHADAIARAFSVRVGGGSWADVARALTAASVPMRTGATVWTTSGAKKLITNPIYMGVLRCTCGAKDCPKERTIPALAVVTPSTWKKAQPTRETKLGRPVGSVGGKNSEGGRLLSGLLRCATCGSALSYSYIKRGDKEYSRYRCRGGERCNAHVSISAPQAEAHLKAEALAKFTTIWEPRLGHDTNVETLTGLENARDEARARFAAWEATSDPLDPGYAAAKSKYREALATAEAALLAESESRVNYLTPDQVREAFEIAPVAEQRRLIREMLGDITVMPGKAPVSERFGTPLPAWRP